MAIQVINIGTTADDGKGDTLRVAMQKINDNTTELYGLLGQDTAGAKGIDISGSTIATTETNADITLSPNGTGAIVLGAMTVSGTTLSAADSSAININENVVIDGDLDVTGTITGTFSTSSIGDISAVGSTLSTPSNADFDLTPGGTGNVNLNGDTVRVGDNDANATITTQGTGDLTLSTNSGTNSGTITIADGANGDITIENNGTGDILLKAGGQVGIGDVSSPDTSLHIKQANAILTLQRTNDTGTPGIDFQQAGGNVRAQIYMDGTNGISKELIFKVQDGTLDERFRVTKSGASVTGTFNIMSDTDSTLSDATISMNENEITTLRSNDNLVLSANGTGTVQTTSNLHLLSATPIIQIQRTDNANVPGISFLGDGGTEGGSIKFDGTDGTTNEIILSSFHSSTVTERLRVTTTGAKVSGTLDIDSAITITDNHITTSRSNDSLDLSANGTGDINLNAGANINIPAAIGLTFGSDTEKIENTSGNNLYLYAGTNIYLNAENDLHFDANGGDIVLKDNNTKFGQFSNQGSKLTIFSGPSSDAEITLGGAVAITGELSLNSLKSTDSSEVLIDDALGISGSLDVGGDLQANTMSSRDSSEIRINDNVSISSNLTVDGSLDVNDINSADSGAVVINDSLQINGILSAVDSTALTIQDGLEVNGALTVDGAATVTGTTTAVAITASGTVTHNAATVYGVQDDLATSTTALSLTKTIHSLAGGESDYTLAAGTEGQIMHFVVAGGTSTANEIALTEITVSQVRNPRDGDVLATYVWRPFIAGTTDLGDSTVPQRTMASCIFANGAWNLDFFTKA